MNIFTKEEAKVNISLKIDEKGPVRDYMKFIFFGFPRLGTRDRGRLKWFRSPVSTTPDLPVSVKGLPVLALKVRAIRQKFTEILTQKGWSERPLMEADIKVFDLGKLDLAVIVRLHPLSNLVKFLGSFNTIKLDQVEWTRST